jgi:hypothetical protein
MVNSIDDYSWTKKSANGDYAARRELFWTNLRITISPLENQ